MPEDPELRVAGHTNGTGAMEHNMELFHRE